MLCNTCRFCSDDDGFCGKGRVLLDNTCSDYVHGEKAAAPPSLPGWLAHLETTERKYLHGIPFPLRGMKEDYRSLRMSQGYTMVRPTRYTMLVSEGEVGYRTLTESISNHIYTIRWGPCRLSIDPMYTGCPVIITMTIQDLDKHPFHEQMDMGSYIWWLDPSAPPAHVELFLAGLMALHDLNYKFIGSNTYYNSFSTKAEPRVYKNQVVRLSPTGVFTRLPPPGTDYKYHNGTHDTLVDDYMKGTRDFATVPINVVEKYYQYWESVLEVFSANLV